MKVQVLRDAQGNLLAAYERAPGALVSVEAQPEEGQRLEEQELADLRKPDQSLPELMQQTFQRPTIQVLRDAQGNLLAAYERTPGALVSVEAQPEEGQRLEQRDLAERGTLDTLLDLYPSAE